VVPVELLLFLAIGVTTLAHVVPIIFLKMLLKLGKLVLYYQWSLFILKYLWDPLEVKLWNSAITTAAPKSRELPVSYH
jgi:hypothetical protein